MNIMYVTTIGTTMGFFKDYIHELIQEGHRVDIACNESGGVVPECYREWGCKVFPISTSRSPFSPGNLKAVQQIKALAAEGKYDIVHCHTPIAAACTRLACRTLRKKGLKVIYTAHGFHFYKGAPLQNWLIFYTIEKLCARWTDVLVTINREDYTRALEKMAAKKVEYVPGVGINIAKFADNPVDTVAKRAEIGVPEESILMLSVGELNANKNHEVILRAMAKRDLPLVHYAIAGKGDKDAYLLELARELKLEDRVHLLGYRTDVADLYKAADLFAFPSFREGLPVSVMEAMAAGNAVVCSNIRGNADMIVDGEGGFLVEPSSAEQFAEAIAKIVLDEELRERMKNINRQNVEAFSTAKINQQMKRIYAVE